ITSRWKCASFSISQTSCSSAGPRGPAVMMFTLSVTGAPDACVKNGRFVLSSITVSFDSSWRPRPHVAGALRESTGNISCGYSPAFSVCTLVEDRANEVEARPCREQRGDPGGVIGRRDLDEIDADHLEAPRDLAQQLLGFVIGEAAVADRRRAGRDR